MEEKKVRKVKKRKEQLEMGTAISRFLIYSGTVKYYLKIVKIFLPLVSEYLLIVKLLGNSVIS